MNMKEFVVGLVFFWVVHSVVFGNIASAESVSVSDEISGHDENTSEVLRFSKKLQSLKSDVVLLNKDLKTMEEKGAIVREKNPSDGRSVIIKLTDYGKEMREFSKEQVIIFNNTIRQHVSEQELEAFFKVTSTINKLIADKMIYPNGNIDKEAV